MICNVCLNDADYGDGEFCPVCGSELDEIEDGEKEKFPWALAYTTNTLLDAQMFKANLESAGIPVQILSQIDSTRMFTVGVLALAKIYVPCHLYGDAREIIAEIEKDECFFLI